MSEMRFKLDLFDQIRVIGQVDKKFIAVVTTEAARSNIRNSKLLVSIPELSSNNKMDKGVLLLFDQHAVHERIRLERLISGKNK